MKNKEFSGLMEERTRRFAFSIIKLSGVLPDTPEGKVIRHQLSKSGTSIGANYREANRSRSKRDFVNKIRICEGEASETAYWLEVVKDQNWISPDLIEKNTRESSELLALFTSIGKSLRSD